MIYLHSLIPSVNNTSIVGGIHMMPFDSEHGMNMTVEELEATGVLIESIPQEPAAMLGVAHVLMYNHDTSEAFYLSTVTSESLVVDEMRKSLQLIQQAIDDIILNGGAL